MVVGRYPDCFQAAVAVNDPLFRPRVAGRGGFQAAVVANDPGGRTAIVAQGRAHSFGL